MELHGIAVLIQNHRKLLNLRTDKQMGKQMQAENSFAWSGQAGAWGGHADADGNRLHGAGRRVGGNRWEQAGMVVGERGQRGAWGGQAIAWSRLAGCGGAAG